MTSLTARRRLSGAVAALLAAGTLTLATGSARADAPGTMEVTPATGSDTSGITLTTTGTCPDPATNLIVSVKGAGFPADGQNVVSNSPISTYAVSPEGGIVVPLTSTMRDYASTAGFTELHGRYDFTLTCRAAFGSTTFGDFTAPIWFTSNTAYRNTEPASAAPTTTGLAVSPAGPVVEGTSVTFTATVAPAAAAGTVQFMDGTKALGSPVAVAGGAASLTTGTLAVGSHALTARFTPTDPNAFVASASAAVPLTVKVKPPALVSGPKVTGTVRAGSTVTCSVAFSRATSQSYAWLRDGAVVRGATGRTFGLHGTDYKHRVACRATGTNSTGSVTATSPSVSVGIGPALRNIVRPGFTGIVKSGHTVTARGGSWTPIAAHYVIIWRRDGRAIPGATHTGYTLTRADRGHLLSLTIIAQRPGWTSGVATSASVRVG
jgi:hypothetical protein